MAGDGRQNSPGTSGPGPRGLDTSVPHIARVYDYWLGGKDNFAVDREAAEQVIAAYPDILHDVRAQRAFLVDAVSYLAGVAGIRQFLDIGTGFPTANNTHQVAQDVAPECRVVYVDNDPMVLSHARALLVGVTGPTDYVDADLRDTGKVLAEAARLLDFSEPIAVMLISVLHFIPDEDDPHAIVTRLMEAVPSGSWLALSHPARDVHPQQVTEAASRFNQLAPAKVTLRTRAEILRLFDGLDLLEPGLVQVHRWRPGLEAPGHNRETAGYCGLARKG
jgi:SAM-dependent methyltransferase